MRKKQDLQVCVGDRVVWVVEMRKVYLHQRVLDDVDRNGKLLW